MITHNQLPLAQYRVLDLTDRKGWMAGKILGDLGADVIKIEKPGGDPDRKIGPFYNDVQDPEKSLFWLSYNTSKKGITLDITKPEGAELFKKMASKAFFVIESFPPGYLTDIGLGYQELAKLNPSLIMTSITPFGQTGPYKDLKASDLVALAMGGVMYHMGDPDRAPVRFSVEQTYPQVGAQAAVGTLIAHYYRQKTGNGQHVDISMQEAVAFIAYMSPAYWELKKDIFQRSGPKMFRGSEKIRRQIIYPCKDGYVCWQFLTSVQGDKTKALVDWMDSEGMAPDFLKNADFISMDFETVKQNDLEKWEKPIANFFLTHTRKRLGEEATKRGILLFPVNDIKGIVDSEQLSFRKFWQEVEHPELKDSITYPGGCWHSDEPTPKIDCRAPLIGEHNELIYKNELGLTLKEIESLRGKSVI